MLGSIAMIFRLSTRKDSAPLPKEGKGGLILESSSPVNFVGLVGCSSCFLNFFEQNRHF